MAPFFMDAVDGNLGGRDYAIFDYGSAGQYSGVSVGFEKRSGVQTSTGTGPRAGDCPGYHAGVFIFRPCTAQSFESFPRSGLNRWRSGVDDHCDSDDLPLSRRSDGHG